MRVYVAGPLFSVAERAWLDAFASRLRADGFDCFVPYENFGDPENLGPEEVYAVDVEGLRSANALVAWLDGPGVDDGTACEIGMFAQLVASGSADHVGLVGVSTDLRHDRVRRFEPAAGINLFVAGAIAAHGRLCFGEDEAVAALRSLRSELERRRTGS